MKILEISTNRVLADFIGDPDTILSFRPRLMDAGRQHFRRNDQQFIPNDSRTYKVELTFKFQRLTQDQEIALEAIWRSRKSFICIPDPIDEPKKAYIMRWTSPFDFQDTVPTDWSQGKSGQAVFREI